MSMIEATTIPTRDPGELKRAAVDNIIFYATPRLWLNQVGPWALDTALSKVTAG